MTDTTTTPTPADLIDTPNGTVTVVCWPDGMVQVVADVTADQAAHSADWAATMTELARLGYGPYSLSDGPGYEAGCEIWPARLTPAS